VSAYGALTGGVANYAEVEMTRPYGLGDQVFISYRGNYYSYAEALKQSLERDRLCKTAILFPPNSLCETSEILLPYEYIELMEFISDHLSQSDAFMFLNTPDYQDSYFTQAELLQWRRFKDDPAVYAVGGNGNQFQLGDAVHLEPLTGNEKKLWAGISVGIARSYKSHLNPGFACGKFAKSCFMIPCGGCGEHFLATQKAIYDALKGQFKITCPLCGNGEFYFREMHKRGNYYRKPIVLEQEFQTRLRVLETQEILDLLISNELPPSISLVSMPGESLSSDIVKLGKFYLALGGLALGALALTTLFSDEDDE
jgi:hypothetical protein